MYRYREEALRLIVVEALRRARSRGVTYRELADSTGVDETLLARYVSGKVVPGVRQAERIWKGLLGIVGPARLLAESLEKGKLDVEAALGDPLFILMAQLFFLDRIRERIDTILVPEAAGIGLATALGLAFGVNVVVARRTKEYTWAEYVEAGFEDPASGRSMIFYARKDLLKGSKRILIVDDIVQTGRTLHAMEKIVEAVGGRVAAIAAVVTVGSEWRRFVRSRVVPILEIAR
ncbi:phosphoribosyltransferase family protein [Aeropyrum camini]|uniref:Adenine/guanine phosphoribosyltransferase n=1 Tax=Aeropyrum camini SY1 = JCM 12091 TaxID=1198449 RepID=U3TBU3_9CREN|nr:phosphoribosyltransferase family protein [Aeropyrum camini]BAN89515.1 adenine/guanine phosphoribosyltransferase [Aeropyrum camini SY1 = JCM 12091]